MLWTNLNGHIGEDNYNNIERMHEGHGYGRISKDGQKVVGLTVSLNFTISGTFFSKRVEHSITYKSGDMVVQKRNQNRIRWEQLKKDRKRVEFKTKMIEKMNRNIQK